MITKEYPIVDEHRTHYVHFPAIINGKWYAVDVNINGGYFKPGPERPPFDTEEECMKGCTIHNRFHGWSDDEVREIVSESMGL